MVGDYTEAVAHAKAVDDGEWTFGCGPNVCAVDIDSYGCYEKWSEPTEEQFTTDQNALDGTGSDKQRPNMDPERPVSSSSILTS